MMELDDIDRALLRALARDATQSAGALGRDLGLSQPATWRRIKRLKDSGVIAGHRLQIDAEAVGFWRDRFPGRQTGHHGARQA